YGIEAADTNPNSTSFITNGVGATIQGGAAAIHTSGHGGISLVNSGAVTGAIELDSLDGNDIIVNHGKIKGAIHLGNGVDTFDGTGGPSGQVFGDAGNDVLGGGGHADRLHGGAGNDKLTGHGGADKFFFDTALNPVTNVDHITDFTAGVDKIVLSATYFAGIGLPGALAAGEFFPSAPPHPAQDPDIYHPTNSLLPVHPHRTAPARGT